MLRVIFILSLLSLIGCGSSPKKEMTEDTAHMFHGKHAHAHSKTCNHKRVTHGGHNDFDHDGHFHHSHNGHFDEHGRSAKATKKNHSSVTRHPAHSHKHGKNCGHKLVTHGDHQDYIHDGHYHYRHEDHVDEHGVVVTN